MSAFPPIDAAVGRRVLELVRGCTFDDFILAPQYSVLPRRDPDVIDLSCQLTRGIVLRRPVVSAGRDHMAFGAARGAAGLACGGKDGR